ncbi:MAG TPA: hypothetical protein PLR60_05905 [Syntrophorhabdaceae bacterium]|nr:hypothetical protein [Syntrophorhabdaceae bacterium]
MTWSYVGLTMLAVNIQGAPATRPCLRGNFPAPALYSRGPGEGHERYEPGIKRNPMWGRPCVAQKLHHNIVYMVKK